MPDTLCRRCGTELSIKEKCRECFQTTSEICPKCNFTPLEKFHQNCWMMSDIPNKERRLQEVLAI